MKPLKIEEHMWVNVVNLEFLIYLDFYLDWIIQTCSCFQT